MDIREIQNLRRLGVLDEDSRPRRRQPERIPPARRRRAKRPAGPSASTTELTFLWAFLAFSICLGFTALWLAVEAQNQLDLMAVR